MPSSPEALEAEARAFMDAYARDLRAGDGDAVAARYRRSGAYRMGHGRKVFAPHDSIRARYLERWQGPTSFEWGDLSYEVLGPEAVLVTGTFRWGRADPLDDLVYSYTAVLTREDGELRLLLEDESTDPRTLD
ncbi:MAG: hypothetical protein R3181_01570 [Rubricoccaceae bacterium]|nr:hypothetical protein [Rubricoccaceae bacterium]